MTTQLMPSAETQLRSTPASAAGERRHADVDRAVQQIIDAARSQPAGPPARVAWGLSGLSMLLLWASFTPLDWGPLGWIALAPLIVLIRLPQLPRRTYLIVYVTGFLGTLAIFQWMRLGHPMMYLALLGLSLYVAVYYPLFVGLSRFAVQRFGMPLMLAAPVVWVAIEYTRSNLMTGCPWYLLSHTQHDWIELIQICDLTGAYGVSFLLVTASACLAGQFSGSWFRRLGLTLESDTRRRFVAVGVMLGLLAATLVYGSIRRADADFTQRPGPRVALVQGNFPAGMKHDKYRLAEIVRTHYRLTGLAVPHQPDLIVWPETMYRSPLIDLPAEASDEDLDRLARVLMPERSADEARAALREFGRQAAGQLTEWSEQTGAALVIGVEAYTTDGEAVKHYNSAAYFTPEGGQAGRYDKMHRVIFGEYVPLRDTIPFLQVLTPFSPGSAVDAGQSAEVFNYRGWRFAPTICFEDTVPHLVRRIVKSTKDPADGRSVDCLLNLTNDGWFHGSSELNQHLITAVFRAVECRTPMVRAVNTGISAVIDGDGVIREPDVFIDADGQGRRQMRDPRTGRFHKQLNAVLVADVPLDSRRSLYVAWGDWFAGGCTGLAVMLVLAAAAGRWRKSRVA